MRRFSPPDRLSTGQSDGGQRKASIATSSWLSSVQPSTASILPWRSPISSISASKSVSSFGIAHLGRDRVEAVDHVGDVARAVLDVLQHGLGRIELRLLLQIADGDVLARPGLAGNSLSMPAMIFISVDLPAPFGPTMPILAP